MSKTEISLRYNPFEATVKYEYNGSNASAPKCIGNGEKSRLQDWLYDFFPDLKTIHNWGNGSECVVSFYGTPGDFDDLENAKDVFIKDHPGITISLNHINKESKSFATRLSDLRTIFQKMQDESLYEELRDPRLKPPFEEALSSEFEISVIATMSSGKSTLINAILGQDILPARNEATTTKIAKIYDDDNAKGWTVIGKRKDEDGIYHQVTDEKIATPDEIENLSNSNEVSLIEIKGNIPEIESREMILVLSDTPGPNNSRTPEHAAHIESLIQADYKPMIMYILNATQLEINDDKELLEKLAKAMENSGKQGSDRFLFVLNKADVLDPGKKEYIEKKVADCKAYLEIKFGIKEARIFPISAELAKLIRTSKAGRPLTGNEEDFLMAKRNRFIKEKEKHLSDHVSLSPSCRKRQEEILKDAIAKNDENTQALVYSGITAIELAMDEYLEKYAITAKISKAVDVFSHIIKKLNLKNLTEKELTQNEEKRKETDKQLEHVQEQIENGEEAKKLKERLDEDIERTKTELQEKFSNHETDILKWFNEISLEYDNEAATPDEAKKMCSSTYTKIEEKYEVLSGEFSRLFDKKLKNQAKSYINEYHKYISSLLSLENLESNAAFNLIQIAIPENVDVLLKEFSKERHEGNINKRWYKPWTWLDEKYREWVEVDMKKIFAEQIRPNFKQFFDMIDNAGSAANQNAEELKMFFSKEIHRLEKEIKKITQKQRDIIKSKNSIEDEIKKNKDKIKWLKEFQNDLDNILRI